MDDDPDKHDEKKRKKMWQKYLWLFVYFYQDIPINIYIDYTIRFESYIKLNYLEKKKTQYIYITMLKSSNLS